MKTILCLFVVLAGLVCIPSLTLAQSKFTLSATVAPFYEHSHSTNTIVLPSSAGGSYNSKITAKTNGAGYWVGLNAGYTFAPRWSVSTGFWFRHSNLNAPIITKDPLVTILSGKSKSHNFLVPVQLNFQTSSGKLSPYFSAGALCNFKSEEKIDIQEGFFHISDKRVKIAPMVGAGVIYHFMEHYSLVAQPAFSYTATGKDAGWHSYRLSFNAQLMYKF